VFNQIYPPVQLVLPLEDFRSFQSVPFRPRVIEYFRISVYFIQIVAAFPKFIVFSFFFVQKMDQDHPNESVPCANGCGFFGRSSTGGMCSRCFKEHVQLPDVKSSIGRLEEEKSKLPAVSTAVADEKEIKSNRDDRPNVKKLKIMEDVVDRSRCSECRKKVGLTAIECRCGKVYCGAHRIAEKHSCTFDFKAYGRQHIEKANERVVAQSLVDKL